MGYYSITTTCVSLRRPWVGDSLVPCHDFETQSIFDWFSSCSRRPSLNYLMAIGILMVFIALFLASSGLCRSPCPEEHCTNQIQSSKSISAYLTRRQKRSSTDTLFPFKMPPLDLQLPWSKMSEEDKKKVFRLRNAESARRSRQKNRDEQDQMEQAYQSNQKRIEKLEKKVQDLSTELSSDYEGGSSQDVSSRNLRLSDKEGSSSRNLRLQSKDASSRNLRLQSREGSKRSIRTQPQDGSSRNLRLQSSSGSRSQRATGETSSRRLSLKRGSTTSKQDGRDKASGDDRPEWFGEPF